MNTLIVDEEIENLQKKSKNRFIILIVILAITFIGGLIVGIPAQIRSGEPLWFAIVITLIVDVVLHGLWGSLLYYCIAKRAYDRFNITFKDKYVLKTVVETNLFDNVSYDRKSGFTYDMIREAAVINPGEPKYFSAEDMLCGHYKDIEFYFSDVITQKLEVHNRKPRVDTIFSGQVMRFATFDDSKESDAYLQIFQKEFLSNVKGWTAQHKIQTENATFNQRFQIYASDQHNAFYILTPQLMEKITEFADSINEQISLSFYGSEMYVAINRFGSIFDAKVDIPIAEQKMLILDDLTLLQKAGDILLQRRNTRG